MSFKWFTKPTNADNRDFGFREPLSDFGFNEPLSEPRSFDRVDILTGTPVRDVFELEPRGYGTQSLDDNFIALGIPTKIDLPEYTEVDLLVYREQERVTYLERFQAPTARSYTYIEDFDPIEDEIIVGGKPYRIEIDPVTSEAATLLNERTGQVRDVPTLEELLSSITYPSTHNAGAREPREPDFIHLPIDGGDKDDLIPLFQ